MSHSKKFAVLIILGALGGFLAFVFHSLKLDEAQERYRGAESKLRGLQKELAGAEAALATEGKKLEEAKAKAQEGLALKKRNDDAVAERSRLESELARVESAYVIDQKRWESLLQSVRAATIGREYPQIRIGNQTLNGARITKITGTSVTFSHSGGAVQATAGELPPELAERLRLDPSTR